MNFFIKHYYIRVSTTPGNPGNILECGVSSGISLKTPGICKVLLEI
jgi:hypothetical protein